MKILKMSFFFVGIFLILIFSGCTKELNSTGHLVLTITDDPLDPTLIESVNVTITKIEARRTDTVSDSPFITLMEQPVNVDLFVLRNGLVDTLANMDVPAGSYDLVRIYVEGAKIGIKDMSDFDLKVPSGSQTGIKVFLKPQLNVVGGLSSDLLLDFDLNRSLVVRGNLRKPEKLQGFIFKPVIRVVNQSYAGTVFGQVVDTNFVELTNASVWIQADTVLSTTLTGEDGQYIFMGILEGSYDLYATHEGFDTVSFNNVVVYAGNKTQQNFILTPLN